MVNKSLKQNTSLNAELNFHIIPLKGMRVSYKEKILHFYYTQIWQCDVPKRALIINEQDYICAIIQRVIEQCNTIFITKYPGKKSF